MFHMQRLLLQYNKIMFSPQYVNVLRVSINSIDYLKSITEPT